VGQLFTIVYILRQFFPSAIGSTGMVPAVPVFEPERNAVHPRLVALWDEVRGSYWFVPALMTVSAAMLALALTALDATLSDEAIAGLAWVYGGGPEGARALLSTVAGSVITVAGTTFSITIAALTLASSQFGPRLLRTFVRDTGNQVVLGTFIATFLYCLIVLRTIRGLEDARVVPHLSVTVGVLLATASIGVLIYFIHHVATAIQADHIILAVSHDLDTAIDRLFPDQVGWSSAVGDRASATPRMSDDGAAEVERTSDAPQIGDAAGEAPICGATSGYLQMVDADRVMQLAVEHDLVLRLVPQPGDFVIAGSPLAWGWPGERISAETCAALTDAFVVSSARTQQQDVRLTINQLVEIAVRALSPGVNDPFTALTCLDRLGAALCRLAGRTFPRSKRFDDRGHVRVIAPVLSYAMLVRLALEPIRHYGRADPQVLRHLLLTVGVVADCARTTEQIAALWAVAEQVRHAAASLVDGDDRARISAEAHACAAQLSSRRDTLGEAGQSDQAGPERSAAKNGSAVP
jgi:uncharacterized membrane protein